MAYTRKSKTAEDVEWQGRVYRREPAHRSLHRQRYFMATTAPRSYLHCDIYEFHHGPIPEGWHVHHKDWNFNNNDPDNLIALAPSEHAKEHAQSQIRFIKKCDECGKDYSAVFTRSRWCSSACKEKRRRRDGVAYVRPKKPAVAQNLICAECGASFQSTKSWAKFCSPKCKRIHRRKGL
jgi:hypothetical protein